jgi:acyl dehydratase
MPLDPSAVGRQNPPRSVSWTSTEAILYALGVGAGVHDLSFTTENTHGVPQRVLPTFAVIVGLPTRILRDVGSFDRGRLVHGRQAMRLLQPLPVNGTVDVQERVVAVEDKGEGRNGVVVTAATIVDADTSELLAETTMTVVIRGAGGFGGTSQPSPQRWVRPTHPPDVTRRYPTSPDQALLYRLSGDRNPLHSDPRYATERAGFPQPILHGLCTYGFAGRALLEKVCGGDVAEFGEMDARFAAPVYPGEELTVRIWRHGRTAAFEVTAGSDQRVVLDHGTFQRAEARTAPSSIGTDSAGPVQLVHD